MDAGKRTINSIFDTNWHLDIPFFQRSYVWGESEWERFLSDMYDVSEKDEEYFLGSVILKDESESIKNKMVIDGQQRLTTLVLFFKVLCLLKNNNDRFDTLFKTMEGNKSIIRHNKNDRKSFELILNLASLQHIENPNNKIEKCYNYFKENIDTDKLHLPILTRRITFVGVYLHSHENEQQIFDTINSIGVKLTTAELLKSLFFRTDEIELYEKHWENIFEKDTETVDYWHTTVNSKEDGKNLIDILLFSFLQIQSKDLPSGEKKNFGQLSNMLKSYKNFIPTIEDKSVFFEDLAEFSNLFKKHINPHIANQRLENQMDRINLIIFEGGLFSIIPYVMFILMHYEYAPEQRDEVLSILESYLLRRMVGIDKGTLIAKDYAELFGVRLIANDITSANALKIHFNGYKENHLHFVPTDNTIKLLLKNKAQTQAKALLILYLLDSKIRQNKGVENLLEFSKYSAEYLMPTKWQRNWPQPLNEDMRKLAIKTLGNTTITPLKLNNALKEANWHTRVNGTGRIKGLMSYSHLSFMKALLHKDKWTDDDIFMNNERLAKLITETWKLT